MIIPAKVLKAFKVLMLVSTRAMIILPRPKRKSGHTHFGL
jgi:hypothetical protein